MALLPFFSLRGDAYRCGQKYGSKFATAILGFLQQETPPSPRALQLARRCQTYIEKYSPSSWHFLQGIKRASGLSIDHLVLLTLHEEIVHQPHCTAFVSVAPKSRRTLVGQNWDWLPQLHPWPSMLRIQMSGSPALLCYSYPGLWSCCGVNETGLALMWTGTGYFPPVPPQPGLPTYPLIFELLQQTSLEDAMQVLSTVPRAGSFIFFLANDRGHATVVEASPSTLCMEAIDRDRPWTSRANHYEIPKLKTVTQQKKRLVAADSNTLNRAREMRRLLDRLDTVTLGDAQQILHHQPHIYRVGLDSLTVDSLIADCQTCSLHVSRGGFKPGSWQPFRF